MEDYNDRIHRLRFPEYPNLLNTTYLDHAGTTLYAKSLIDAYHKDLTSNLYGNPHSESPASWSSTERVNEARHAVLSYFHADPNKFDIVFTANSTNALKILADCFREKHFEYAYHKDAHSSLVGIREVAQIHHCIQSEDALQGWLEQENDRVRLFGYPAQSNMTGHRLPYSWCKTKKAYVVLDAASYLTSGRLDLSDDDAAPHFIVLSFYKIFGYPDLGALIVKKDAAQVLMSRKYFGGGTVDIVTALDGSFHMRKRDTIHDFLEDGTLPFHNIIALTHAISLHQSLFISAQAISEHTASLSAWLYKEMSALRHDNGTPVVEIYSDGDYGDPLTQGPIMAFNIKRGNGEYAGKSHVEKLAIACGFQLRTGGVCNPGGIASKLNLKHWELRRNLVEGVRCGGDTDVVAHKPTGIIRVSLGPMSTKSDVQRFARFIRTFFVDTRTRELEKLEPITSITPVEGAKSMEVPSDAYQVWHHQWLVVDDDGRKAEGLDITVSIDVVAEQLVLSSGNGRAIVSLWDLPAPENGTYSRYRNEHLSAWLSDVAGSNCTLARYRKLREPDRCVVVGCESMIDRDQVAQHYERHAETFKRLASAVRWITIKETTLGGQEKTSASFMSVGHQSSSSFSSSSRKKRVRNLRKHLRRMTPPSIAALFHLPRLVAV